jgi:uncharacterized membrane protein YhaH (DUF805 family)
VSDASWLLSFRGRIGRADYWRALLVTPLLLLVLGVPVAVALSQLQTVWPRSGPLLFAALEAGIALVYLYILSAVGAKRCHDLDLSGWVMLAAFVPIANLCLSVVLAVIRGTKGGNRFGPDPLADADGSVLRLLQREAALLFAFSGRIGRGDYCLVLIATSLVLVLGLLLPVAIVREGGILPLRLPSAMPLAGWVAPLAPMLTMTIKVAVPALLVAAYLYVQCAAGTKRCHDRGLSGYHMAWGLVPIAGFWLLFQLCFLRGEPRPNQYGAAAL